MTRLAKPEKKAGKGTTNGAECTPIVLAIQSGHERAPTAYRSLYMRDLQDFEQLCQ